MNVGELKAFLADIPDERDVCVVRGPWEEFRIGVAGTALGRILLFEEEEAPVDVAKHCAEQEEALRPTYVTENGLLEIYVDGAGPHG